MDLFSLLKKDHSKVKKLLNEVTEKEEFDQKLVRQICEELLLHMEKEERYLYPVLQGIDETKELAEEAVLEHQESKNVIEALRRPKLSQAKLKVKLEVLQLEINHHIEEEEKEMFPQIKKILSTEQIADISEKIKVFAASGKENSSQKKQPVG